MTVEERAKNVIDKTTISGWEYDTLKKEIEKALRDQIEDCAKVADKTVEAESRHSTLLGDHIAITETGFSALLIAQNIRALTVPKEEKPDDDGVEDRFKPGGFWFQ